MSHQRTTRCILGALMLLLAPGARAESEVERLRRLVEELERSQQQTIAELDELRARVEGEEGAPQSPGRASDAAPDLATLAGRAPAPRSIDFHGHLAVSYFGFEEMSLAPDQGPSLSDLNPQSSFVLSDLTLFVGIPLRDNLYAATEIEYELGGDEIDLDQAFIQWDLRAEERLALRLGKFYVPFGIERFYQNAPQNPLVDHPAPFIHVIPGTYSDTGVALVGKRPILQGPEVLLEYEAAFVNGLGSSLFDSAREARQNVDNNADKAVVGRIGLGYDRWLRIGASWMIGEYDDGDEDRFWALGADLRASLGPVFVRGEWVHSDLHNPDLVDANGVPCSDAQPLCPGLTPPLTPLGGSFQRRGGYLEASYRQDAPFSLPLRDVVYVLRFDTLDEDDSAHDLLDAKRWALGVVLRPYDHLRLKLQYEITDEDSDEFDNNAFLFEGSVDW